MDSEQLLLTLLKEECAEIQLEISLAKLSRFASKAARFGLEETNVSKPDGPNNQENLVDELNDLMGAIDICVDNGILPQDWLDWKKVAAKKQKIKKYHEFSKNNGRVDQDASLV